MSRIWRIYPSKKIFGIWSWYVNYKQSPKSWQSSPKICNLLALVALMVFMSLNPLTTMMQLSYSLISAKDYCIFHFHCIFYCIFYCIIYCIYLLIYNFFIWQINQVHLACLSNFGIIIGGCLGRFGRFHIYPIFHVFEDVCIFGVRFERGVIWFFCEISLVIPNQ